MLQKFACLSTTRFILKSSTVLYCPYSLLESLQTTFFVKNLANFHSRHLSYTSRGRLSNSQNVLHRKICPHRPNSFSGMPELFHHHHHHHHQHQHRTADRFSFTVNLTTTSHPFSSDISSLKVGGGGKGKEAEEGEDDMRMFHLKSRSLIHIAGADSSSFLQGLITNDMLMLENNANRTIYAMILNVQGRVLYDLFIYAVPNQPAAFFLECNSDVVDDLIKLFKKYKIRKKVTLENISEKFQVWASFSASSFLSKLLSSQENSKVEVCSPDPRVHDFGFRLILPHNNKCVSHPEEEYHTRRYQIGIAEGTSDLPPGSCFPLESNLEFLHGVSFQKGCYIGQELTARTHHRGVIRKRLVPISFETDPGEIAKDQPIIDSNGKRVGKFRGNIGKHGLALLQLKPVLQIQNGFFDLDNHKVKPQIPVWWPNLSI
ncbi:putative transferase CAF17 homolog, mitochondrial [Argonauta hians]